MVTRTWQDPAGAHGFDPHAGDVGTAPARENTERVEAWAFTPLAARRTIDAGPMDAEPSWPRLDPYAVGAAAVGAALIALAIFGG